jgi:hypothetical protein
MAAMPGALSYLEPVEQRELLDDLNCLSSGHGSQLSRDIVHTLR